MPTLKKVDEQLPDFEAMSIEEISAYRVGLRTEMRRIKDLIDASNETFRGKIALMHLGAQLRIDTEGLSADDAAALRRIAQFGPPRPGDVVAEPGALDSSTTGQAPEAK